MFQKKFGGERKMIDNPKENMNQLRIFCSHNKEARDRFTWLEQHIEETSKARDEEFIRILNELRTNNPYPTDIFTGRTEEGKIGQYGRIV